MLVNGSVVEISEDEHGLRLLDFLRNRLGLTGAKEGCGVGECGSCTVTIDGSAQTSCLVLVGQVLDSDIRTVEGLREAGHGALQDAFVECQAVQCGYCIPGVLNACATLLDRQPKPDREDVRRALDGNLCRCTAYNRFFDAVEESVKFKRVREDRGLTDGID